jgi:hypothetical protein
MKRRELKQKKHALVLGRNALRVTSGFMIFMDLGLNGICLQQSAIKRERLHSKMYSESKCESG